MLNRLRGVLKLDAVVPVVLIAAALLMTLDPTVLGVTITERQIVLAFFGFLGIDTLIERTGRLRRMERRLETLAEKAPGPQAAGQVLRARSSFERMDVLIAQARRSVLIIGVNLEGALGCTTALAALARPGVERGRWPILTSVTPDYLAPIQRFFDRQYAAHDRYWWRGPNRYSTNPAAHTPFMPPGSPQRSGADQAGR